MKNTTAIRYFQKNAHMSYLKNNTQNVVLSIIVFKFGEKKLTKEKFASKNPKIFGMLTLVI